jgi:lipopolysaccharide/colanic/teichoic acid biosynthesis glycosyltransferase
MNSTGGRLRDRQVATEQADNVIHLNSGGVYTLIRTDVRQKPFYQFAKRAADVIFSLLALILLSPVFLVVAIAIKLDSKGPVIYCHRRVGQNRKELKLYKFRSMVKNAEDLMQTFTPEQMEEFEENYKLESDPRVTRIGKFLRESSLDELPQLLNILQGDLSFVGPRPLVETEIEKYGMYSEHFLSVKPGLTGNWQVNGRNNTTYRERIALELYYVDHASLWLDVKILLKTVPVVLSKIGAK